MPPSFIFISGWAVAYFSNAPSISKLKGRIMLWSLGSVNDPDAGIVSVSCPRFSLTCSPV